MRSIVFLVLLALFCLILSTPQHCNGGASGNSLSVKQDEQDIFEDKEPIPEDEKFMFDPNTPEDQLFQKDVPPKVMLPLVSPQDRGPFQKKSRFNTRNVGNVKLPKIGVKVKTPLVGVKAELDINGAKDLLNSKGLKIHTVGKIQFAELDQKMTEQCLTQYQFCSISCAKDFGLSCSPEAKIFSVFVTKTEHANLCVRPRVLGWRNTYDKPRSERVEDREQCVLRPCQCKTYERNFIGRYGKVDYENGLKYLQKQCNKWCTSGVKPKWVISENDATSAINSIKGKLLALYKRLFPFLRYFLKFGMMIKTAILDAAEFVGDKAKKGAKIVGDNVQKGAVIAGTNIAKGATVAGKNIAKGAVIAGTKVSNGAKSAANAVASKAKNVGKKIGGGFKKAGSKIKSFFRRRW